MLISFLDKGPSKFLITGVQRLFTYSTTQQHKLLGQKQHSRRKISFFNNKRLSCLQFKPCLNAIWGIETRWIGSMCMCVCVWAFVKPPPYVRAGMSRHKRVTKLLSEQQMTAALSGEQPCSLGYGAGGVCTQTLCRGSPVKKNLHSS